MLVTVDGDQRVVPFPGAIGQDLGPSPRNGVERGEQFLDGFDSCLHLRCGRRSAAARGGPARDGPRAAGNFHSRRHLSLEVLADRRQCSRSHALAKVGRAVADFGREPELGMGQEHHAREVELHRSTAAGCHRAMCDASR